MPKHTFRRALFVRLDRIGDLVLTLPTDQALVAERTDWWIPRGLSFVTDLAVPPRSAREFASHCSLRQLTALARDVRQNQYDLAVIFHAPWWASFVIWLARVPIRIGVRSQWHSFVFLNRGVRQKRSRAEFSELEYNFRLIEKGLSLPIGSLNRRPVTLHSKSGRLELAPTGEYYVVHPGMSGSALNWPIDRYAALIEHLSHKANVVITGTASDDAVLIPLKSQLAHAKIVWLDGKISGDELVTLLQSAKAVIAPSTGVLHLAASTGVPTLGIFSNIKVQRSVRWGPQGPRTAVVEPPMDHESETCMNEISLADVLQKLDELSIG